MVSRTEGLVAETYGEQGVVVDVACDKLVGSDMDVTCDEVT
jgi:hypothetical protein